MTATPYTDADAVRLTCNTQLEDDPLELIVADAHRLIDKLLGADGLTVEELEAIERWYACHLCWAVDPYLRITSDHTGQSSVSLEGTDRFLKQAIMLDPTGKLDAYMAPEKTLPLFRAGRTTRVPDVPV
jgi:hypothetical protein